MHRTMQAPPYGSLHEAEEAGWTESPAANSIVRMARHPQEQELDDYIRKPNEDDDCIDCNCCYTPWCMVRMRFGLMFWSLFVGLSLITWSCYHGSDPNLQPGYHFMANWNVIVMLVIGIITVLTTPVLIFASANRHRGTLLATSIVMMFVVFYLILVALFLFCPSWQRKIADLDRSSGNVCCDYLAEEKLGTGCPIPDWGDRAAAITREYSRGKNGGKRIAESSNFCQVSVFFLDYGVFDEGSVGIDVTISPVQASPFAITASGKPMFAPYLLIGAATLEFLFVVITLYTRARRSQIPSRYGRRAGQKAKVPHSQYNTHITPRPSCETYYTPDRSPKISLDKSRLPQSSPYKPVPGPAQYTGPARPVANGAAANDEARESSPFARNFRDMSPGRGSARPAAAPQQQQQIYSSATSAPAPDPRTQMYNSTSAAPSMYGSRAGAGPKYTSARDDGISVHVGQIGITIKEVRGGEVEVAHVRETMVGGGTRKLKAGDLIRRIDGEEVSGRGVHFVAARLRGTPGTWITVGFKRFDVDHLQYEHMQRTGELGVFPNRVEMYGLAVHRTGSPPGRHVDDLHGTMSSNKQPAFLSAPPRPPELYPTDFRTSLERSMREPSVGPTGLTPYRDTYNPLMNGTRGYTPRGTSTNPRGIPSAATPLDIREFASPGYYESEARPRDSRTPNRHRAYHDISPDEDRLYGVGIYMQPDELGGLRVASLIPDGPAEASGQVSPGDEIVSIDATPVHGLPLSVLSAALLGARGTVLLLGLRKPGSPSSTNVALVRGAAAVGSPAPPPVPSHGLRKATSPSAPVPLHSSARRGADDAALMGGGSGLSSLGLEFAFRGDGVPVVTRLEPGGPAEASKRIDVNDAIVEIDGVRVFGMSRTFIACLLTGTPSSPVAIALTKAISGRTVHVALNGAEAGVTLA